MISPDEKYNQPKFLNCNILVNQENEDLTRLTTKSLFDIEEMCKSFNQDFPNKHIHLINCICLIEPKYVYQLYDTNERYINNEGEIFIEKERIYNISSLDSNESNRCIYKKIELIISLNIPNDTNIFVKTLSSKTICIRIDLKRFKVYQLKKIISQKMDDLPLNTFKMIFNGKIIDKYPNNINNTLSECNINRDDTIHISPLITGNINKKYELPNELDFKCFDTGKEYKIPIKYGGLHYPLSKISEIIKSNIENDKKKEKISLHYLNKGCSPNMEDYYQQQSELNKNNKVEK